MDNFSNINVGDSVYSLKFGEGIVKSTKRGLGHHIIVNFKNGKTAEFTYNGFLNQDDVTQDLYWSKPKIITPKRKEIDFWICIHKNPDGELEVVSYQKEEYVNNYINAVKIKGKTFIKKEKHTTTITIGEE